MQAQRVVVQEPNQVALNAFDISEPEAGQVLVKARMTLISPGTERAFYLALPNTNANYPLYPGYSFIGDVVAVGDGVDKLQAGDRIACTANHRSHALVDASSCLIVPDAACDEDAVFFNLIAIAMQGIRKARIELGESVLVIGAGLIGLCAIQLARLNGAMPVIAVDIHQERLELAKQVGADYTFISDEALQDNLHAVTRGQYPNVTIEATGVPSVVVKAFQMTAARGRVVLLGSSRGETNGVNFYRDVHRNGLTVIGGHEITRPLSENNPGWWTQVSEHQVILDFLAGGRIETQSLISHRFGWDEFSKAYDLLSSKQMDALGMVIQW
jgi:2-desacetyl-2-hydroxyethyl bacteriochlorophyllide A dehydrogenase